jgi:uroporphyrinogen decarboxylase
LLPFAIEAGFAGVHGLEPAAGVRLDRVKEQFGSDLVLVGNIDIRVLFQPDLGAIHAEVNRSVEQGAQGGGYMLATCNSIFAGMDPAAVAEMFHYQEKVGFYGQGSRGG